MIALEIFPTNFQLEVAAGLTNFSSQLILSNPSAIPLTGISFSSVSVYGATLSAVVPNTINRLVISFELCNK